MTVILTMMPYLKQAGHADGHIPQVEYLHSNSVIAVENCALTAVRFVLLTFVNSLVFAQDHYTGSTQKY